MKYKPKPSHPWNAQARNAYLTWKKKQKANENEKRKDKELHPSR